MKKIILLNLLIIIFLAGCSYKNIQESENQSKLHVATATPSPELVSPTTPNDKTDSKSSGIDKKIWKSVEINNDEDKTYTYNGTQFRVFSKNCKEIKVQYSNDSGTFWDSCPDIDCPEIDNCFMGFASNKFGWMIINGDVSLSLQYHYVYLTEDGGKTWHEVGNTNDGHPQMLSGSGFSEKKIGFLNYIYKDGPTGVVNMNQSLDEGKTWEALQLNLPNKYANCTAQALSPKFDGAEGVMPVEITSEKFVKTINCYSFDYGKTWSINKPKNKA